MSHVITITVNSASLIGMDNSTELKIIEVEKEIKNQIKNNQIKKSKISKIRDETDQTLESWKSYL